MIARNIEQAAVANKRLWPIELNETTSYEEQVLWLIKKVKELEDRVTILEGEVDQEDDNS